MQEVKPEDVILSSWFGYGGQVRRDVEVDDTMIKVSPAFGCILVGDIKAQTIPDQLKVCLHYIASSTPTSHTAILQSNLRGVGVVHPELSYLCEALLVSHCFTEAHELGYVLAKFIKQLKHQVSVEMFISK